MRAPLVITAGALALGAVAVVGLALLDGDEPEATVASGSVAEGSGDADPATEDVLVRQIPAGPREDTPSALDDMGDPSFPPPLVDPSEIRSGGPPPDGIPSIDDPAFQPTAEVDWLAPTEPVLLLEVGDEARVYPVQIMTWHELVNDTFGDVPVTVSYCPLCNSAVAYIREAEGRVLDFGTSGRLLHSSLVMYDRQTESLWSHFTGQAVIGTLTGAQLDTLPVSTVSWETVRTAHPDALVLSRDTGFSRDYGRNPYPGYDDVDRPPFLFDGEVDGRLAAQTRVVSVRGATESVVVVQEDLFDRRVVAFTVDGRERVALLEPGTASALDAVRIDDGRDVGAVGVFDPVVDGRTLGFRPDPSGGFIDDRTGSTWDILGRAIAGPLAGTRLAPVEHLDTFWFAIGAFEPDTRIAGR
jgi:hypothetical protein